MRKLLLCSALTLLAAGCKDGGTSSPVATAVGVTPGTVSLNALGATQVVHAAVTDQNGKAMAGAAITWSSSGASVTVVGAGGDSAVVTAVGNGPATITAMAGSASGSTAVQVAQAAVALQKTSGDVQTGPAGTVLAAPLRVTVRDRLGAAVPGALVSFAAEGGGSVAATTAVSGADGVATTQWTIGTVVGTVQTVTATLPGGVAQVQFSGTVVAGAPAMAAATGNDQSAAPGAAVAVAPRVVLRDAFNNAVAGVNVQFTVTSGGGSITGPASVTTDAGGSAGVGGWTLGPSAGTNTLTATFPGTSLAPVVFTAQGAAGGSLVIAAGNNQAAMIGTAVPTAPAVQVRNAAGNAVPGLTVTFTVTGGGGTVGSATATTDASGVARVASWKLGVGPNTLQATVSGVAAPPVTFRGVGCQGGGGTGFALTLCFTTPMTTSQQAVFQSAAARWSAVITGDLPDVTGRVDEGDCDDGSPTISMTFDDLVIFAAVESIDGPGNILGSAGPCVVRGGTRGLPILGSMRFDAADVAQLESSGGLSGVILHEMGHVLGIGTMWNYMGLLQNPSSTGKKLDTWFSGANGIAGFNSIGGSTYTGGQKVPVENEGGAGTMNGHWRETVLKNELMTGYLNSGVANPLSLLTVRSLTDMGYVVNTAAADAFSLTLSVRGSASVQVGGTPIKLHNDLYQGPVHVMDRGGRMTRIR
jgi:hypothetical protein